jgi:hypothetical protein
VGEVAGEAAVVSWWWQWLFISDRQTIHVISDIFTVFFRFITSFKNGRENFNSLEILDNVNKK